LSHQLKRGQAFDLRQGRRRKFQLRRRVMRYLCQNR
jgi:hypothetical protein